MRSRTSRSMDVGSRLNVTHVSEDVAAQDVSSSECCHHHESLKRDVAQST